MSEAAQVATITGAFAVVVVFAQVFAARMNTRQHGSSMEILEEIRADVKDVAERVTGVESRTAGVEGRTAVLEQIRFTQVGPDVVVSANQKEPS